MLPAMIMNLPYYLLNTDFSGIAFSKFALPNITFPNIDLPCGNAWP